MKGVILSEEELRKEVAYFLKQDAFAFDIESIPGPLEGTRGVAAHNQVVWISLATYGRAITIPLGHPNGDVRLRDKFRKKIDGKFQSFPAVFNEPPKQLRPSVVFEILRPLFFSRTIRKVAHNATIDFVSLKKYFGAIPYGPVSDTIVMQWLLDENIGQISGGPKRPMRKGLKDLTLWYYKVKYDTEEVGKCIEAHEFSKVARYALLDVRYTWTLFVKFKPLLIEDGVSRHADLENEVTEVLFPMNAIGAPVDVEAIKQLETDLTIMLEKIEANIYREAGQIFNINSTPQKQKILFGLKKDGGQGLKSKRLTPAGAKLKKEGMPTGIEHLSTDKEALEQFPDNPLVALLMEYSEIAKLLNTYVRGYLGEEGNPDRPCRVFHGRIHADLVQYGTVTSRFSCREPNLQNIPRPGTDLGTKVRGLFKAPTGYKLVVADYAQIEYRVLAHFLGKGILFDGFWSGVDAHKATAAAMYQVAIEEVTKQMRQDSKAIGFGVLFGAMANKVAAIMKQTVEYAEERIKDYGRTQPEVIQFKKAVVSTARRREIPHITTITGFKRRVWDLNEERWGLRARAERQIFNSLIQGSAAGIIKTAMVRIHKRLLEYNADLPESEKVHLILSVHDELVLQAPEHRAVDAKLMLEEAMAGPEMQTMLKVPLEATALIVDRWSEAKD